MTTVFQKTFNRVTTLLLDEPISKEQSATIAYTVACIEALKADGAVRSAQKGDALTADQIEKIARYVNGNKFVQTKASTIFCLATGVSDCSQRQAIATATLLKDLGCGRVKTSGRVDFSNL